MSKCQHGLEMRIYLALNSTIQKKRGCGVSVFDFLKTVCSVGYLWVTSGLCRDSIIYCSHSKKKILSCQYFPSTLGFLNLFSDMANIVTDILLRFSRQKWLK